jgi:type I restriction enzyme S subunit
MASAEQRAIIDRIEAAQKRITLETNELVKLAQLKTGLMDDLLTGRVRVTPLLNPEQAAHDPATSASS